MSNTPRTDAAIHPTKLLRRADGTFVEAVDAVTCRQLERELAEVKEQLRLCNVDQFTTAAELAELREELNDRRKFAYAVEQALDGLKGDYVEIIKELRKDAERYRWLRDDERGRSLSVSSLEWKNNAELSDAAIDAAMKEGK